MTGIPYLTKAMKTLNITICGLTGHWTLSHNAAVLDSMDQNYNCYIVSCSSPSVFNDTTLGKGGVKGCKMTSFLLQESRDYCYVRSSDIRACFLDAKAAFDKD